MQPVEIILESGARFSGYGHGDFNQIRGGEFVFCTAMSGIEESLTDPSYSGQVIVNTVSHVGNTGFTGEDIESDKIWAEGLICRHLDPSPSNWRCKKNLAQWITEEGRFVVEGIDTRELTLHLRDHGSQRGIVLKKENTQHTAEGDFLSLIHKNIPDMNGRDLTRLVTCSTAYEFKNQPESYWQIARGLKRSPRPLQLAVWDFGVKHNTLRLLQTLGNAKVHVLPAHAKSDELLAAGKDGILLSNGPGDPSAATHIIEELKKVLGKRPLFSICLGHQIVAIAAGAKTLKMKYGHRGIHHPVIEYNSKQQPVRTWITSQNHGFAVAPDSLPSGIHASFMHADDGSIEGLSLPELNCETVQFHPEAGPGPFDSSVLIERFIERIHTTSPKTRGES